MSKIMIPHTVEAHDAIVVQNRDPQTTQLAFYEGDRDVHYVVLPVTALARLARDIAEELKAKLKPSGRR